MKKKVLALFLAGALSMLGSVALAEEYTPGQRTYHVLGSILNSDRHPVHLIVEQKIDMKGIVGSAKYNALPEAERTRINRTEYNEVKGMIGERNIKMDGSGKIIQDITRFIKGQYWYSIDRKYKTYDRIPVIKGAMKPFAENFVGWFNKVPVSGNDPATGFDYDKMTMGMRTLTFYYEKGGLEWKGYEVSPLPAFQIIEVSRDVDVENFFADPGEGFRHYPDNVMRGVAERNLPHKKGKRR